MASVGTRSHLRPISLRMRLTNHAPIPRSATFRAESGRYSVAHTEVCWLICRFTSAVGDLPGETIPTRFNRWIHQSALHADGRTTVVSATLRFRGSPCPGIQCLRRRNSAGGPIRSKSKEQDSRDRWGEYPFPEVAETYGCVASGRDGKIVVVT